MKRLYLFQKDSWLQNNMQHAPLSLGGKAKRIILFYQHKRNHNDICPKSSQFSLLSIDKEPGGLVLAVEH